MNKVSKWFSQEEFACKCGCGEAFTIDKGLLRMLDEIRDFSGKPVIIVSGFRCEAYNKKCGGVSGSAHTKGKAADISIINSKHRWDLLKVITLVNFQRIGIGDTFIHVDVDLTLPNPVVWLYGEKNG